MEADTVVYPGTVMVHFQRADLTYRTVVGPVRLDGDTLLAVSHGVLDTPLLHLTANLSAQAGQHRLPLLLGLGAGQPVHVGTGEDPGLGDLAGDRGHNLVVGQHQHHEDQVENDATDNLLDKMVGEGSENQGHEVGVVAPADNDRYEDHRERLDKTGNNNIRTTISSNELVCKSPIIAKKSANRKEINQVH